MSVGSFGQSSAPGPTLGVEVTGAPTGDNVWMIVNFNLPGPGFLCPPVTGVGTLFWVDPTFPAIILDLGPFPPGCVPIPIPIPGAAPIGRQLLFQFIALPTTGPRATDAAEGLALTVTVP